MERRIFVFLLLFLYPLGLAADSQKTAKIFGVIGFACSLVAVGSDILSENYYNQYEETTDPDECELFRSRIKFCEKIRNISFGLAVTNFSISTIMWLRTDKDDKVGIEFQCTKEKLCLGVVKDF
ncbi:MAG: hypothetical protein JSW02_06215 [candidate division WOR-3 bacterium]|nr:MAG: hypothetical protein JSW02_06215 [candidate division WOR-3 bacterium]